MARLLHDLYNYRESDWDVEPFPGANFNDIPHNHGIYRFRCVNSSKILYIDTASNQSRYGNTLRGCYRTHSHKRNDNLSELFVMYSNHNLNFEHYRCTDDEAVGCKNYYLAKDKPQYNTIKLEVCNNPRSSF